MENREIEEKLGRLEPRRPSDALKRRIAASLTEECGDEVNAPNASSESALTDSVAYDETGEPRNRGKIVLGTTFTALVSAIAAVWAVILVLDYGSEPPRMGAEGTVMEADAASFTVGARPIDQYATLVGAKPSPVYYREDGQAVQQVALRYLDTEVWELENSSETFTVSSYRDEIRVVPVESF